MRTLGIEMCDAGFLPAACEGHEPRLVAVPDANGSTEWPGYCYQDGPKLAFGRTAEDNWFVHPRRVVHTFWARLAHEPSPLQAGVKAPSYSELAFFFLHEFIRRLNAVAGPYEQVVLAIPGSYLKDALASEEKIGLLLGMAGELKLPLAGIIDMACAALCDPRASGFNPALPVVVLDVHLEGADLTLLTTDGRLERKDFIHLPDLGYAHLLKHLTGAMGNRFLRHTTFDILADGRIEQTFFRQTKDFFLQGAAEFRFHINTATRAYEMTAKREQLASDVQSLVGPIVQGVQSFVRTSPHASEPCTIAITDRAAHLPGLEARLRAAGYSRLVRLPVGAAGAGAACLGTRRLRVPPDLADVVVESSVALADTRRSSAAQWDARLQKQRDSGQHAAPTHAILNGIGHAIGTKPRFTIGNADAGADLPLPDSFSVADDCAVPLVQEGGRLWFVDAAPGRDLAGMETAAARTPIEAGDRLTVRCGNAIAEILFAHCHSANGRPTS